MNKINFFITGLTIVFLTSCGTKKVVIATKKENKTAEEVVVPSPEGTSDIKKITKTVTGGKDTKDKVQNYILTFADIAKEEMQQYGIPASITLAQGVLESGAGEGELTQKANNHFGIKCHDWKGARVYHDDDTAQECFRKYSTPKFSFQDHSLFLTGRKRYTGLFKLPKDDYKGWAKGLRAAGYATDKKYPSKLISIIERYKLYQYDAEVLGKPLKDAKKVKDGSDKYTVKSGDTLYSISKKFKLKVEELKAFNGLQDNTIHEGQTLYVQPLPKDF